MDLRHAHHLPFLDASGQAIDIGLALRFDAPHSYTGEDVLELQGHGGPVVLDLVLQRVLSLGARMAKPGEFSERAFLNNKLDLAQAEAVADLIDSSSAAAALAAVRSLNGSFSNSVDAIQKELIALRVWLEAALDFSEDEIDFFSEPELASRAEALVKRFDDLKAKAEQGQRLRDGYSVVIAGLTNVGKSSLLNALSGTDSAIVTDIEGTTRDVLREHLNLDGVPFEFIDTAGLRETTDTVEREGIERAHRAIDSANHVLVLADASDPALPELQLSSTVGFTLLLNKMDLLGQVADGSDKSETNNKDNAVNTQSSINVGHEHRQGQGSQTLKSKMIERCQTQFGRQPDSVLYASVKHGDGLAGLRQHLLQLVGHNSQVSGAFSARRRHLLALSEARMACDAALSRLRENSMPELAAEELRLAQHALDSVKGRFDSEDLLGEIFSSFCIGK